MRYQKQTATSHRQRQAAADASARLLGQVIAQSAVVTFPAQRVDRVEIRADLRVRNTFLARAICAGGSVYGGRLRPVAHGAYDMEWCFEAGCSCFPFAAARTPVIVVCVDD